MVSPKVDPGSLQDLSGLDSLLSGFSEGAGISGSATALLLAMAVQRGMEVPALLLEPKAKDYPATFVTSYGTSKAEFRKGSVGQSNVDDCFYWFGQDGLFSTLNCYVRVGDAYNLWNRHPKWNGEMKKVTCRLLRRGVLHQPTLSYTFSFLAT